VVVAVALTLLFSACEEGARVGSGGTSEAVETGISEAIETVAATTEGATATTGSDSPRTFVVASVVDGDTIRLRNGNRVRLLQIDAPEPGDGECYSRKSRAVLRELLPEGSDVVLRVDPKLGSTREISTTGYFVTSSVAA
jgi:endonuclease YncB( thermonuclease family)